MASLMLKVREIFNLAQDGDVVLSKLCEQMANLQMGVTEIQFWDTFIHHVQKSIIYYKVEPAVERVMDFIANFSTYSTRIKNKQMDNGNVERIQLTPSDESFEEMEIMEPFLLACFTVFINQHNARERGVRLRCCQLVNKMLNLLGDQATIDEDVSDAIYECMMIRIKDINPPVRIQAVLALFRLQDPTDEECPIIDMYLRSMERDKNCLVRKTILTKLAISRKTLPFLIGRTRDINNMNRKTAYIMLSEKVSIRALSISQRIKLLSNGLKNDHSPDVNKACKTMLKAWFRSCDHNFIKLLEALDTESAPECSEIAIESLLKDSTIEQLEEYIKQLNEFVTRTPEGNVKLLDHKSLTPEKAFFWYAICKYLKTCSGGELLLEQVLPELTHFCEYIRFYAEKNFIDSAILTAFDGIEQSEFILQYLLNIAGLLDLSDEIGRKNLHTLVHDLLVLESIPNSLVSVLVKRCKDVEENEDSFVQSIVETISDIKHPLVQVVSTAMKEQARKVQLQLARVSVNIHECNEDLECAIKQQDYQQAALLKDHISELEKQKSDFQAILEESQECITKRVVREEDPETKLKCLTIGTAMLSEIVKRGLSSTLMTLKDELFFEGVKNEDPCIRNEAVKGLGLLSLLQKEFASQHLVFFLQVVQVDQEFVQITAIKVIFDLFLMYGLTAFDQDCKTKDTLIAEDEQIEGDETLKEDADKDNDPVVSDTDPEKQDVDDDEDIDKELTAAAEGVLSVLLMFLQSESSDLRSIVAEGMAKVMITGRVVSANVLTRLILLWYNPITEDDVQLRHCLGTFLPAFAFTGRKNQELVEAAFLPTLRTITKAPATSPLSHINISNVIDLFIQLTDVRNLSRFRATNVSQNVQDEYDTYVHDTIALKVSNEILSDPEDPDIKLFCKALNQLTICPKNTLALNDLIELSKQMINALNNNHIAKSMVEKFYLQLQEFHTCETHTETPNGVVVNSEHSNTRGLMDDDDDDDDDNTVNPLILASVLRNPLTLSLRSNCSARANRSVTFASPPPKMQKLSISSIDFQLD